MRLTYIITSLTLCFLVFIGTRFMGQEHVSASILAVPERIAAMPLIIYGQGGPSMYLFERAAKTYQREHGGEVYKVIDGDEFIAAFLDFYKRHGALKEFVYFGHGNHLALFVNQEPGVHGSVYTNDARTHTDYRSSSIFQLPSDTFAPTGIVQFYGCNIADGFEYRSTFAQQFADYFNVEVRAPTGPTEFTKTPHIKDPFTGSTELRLHADAPVYMVPSYANQGFKRFNPQPIGRTQFTDVPSGTPTEAAITGLMAANIFPPSVATIFAPYNSPTIEELKTYCQVTKYNCAFLDYKANTELASTVDVLYIAALFADPLLRRHSLSAQSSIAYLRTLGIITKDDLYKQRLTNARFIELLWLGYKQQIL